MEAELARNLSPAATLLEPPSLVGIPAGWFLMGSPDSQGQQDERPQHRVWVDEFEMARCPVTNREYARYLEASGEPAPRFWNHPDFSRPDQPVAGPSWFEADAYTRWLSRQTGENYRLPTEAEWERASRAGLEGARYPWGDESPETRPDYSSRWKNGPEDAGTAPPNAFGVFDLCENVHEWCLDWYNPRFYAGSPERNPLCREAGTEPARRASRGGSWRHHVKLSRCAARSSIPPMLQYADYGFRVMRSPLMF